MNDYQELDQSDDGEINDSTLKVYPTYRRRWFYLFVVCLAQISNAFIWINFSPIANLGVEYYKVNYDAINWLSLMYMIVTIPFTLPSTWLIDKLGVRVGMYIGVWMNAIGSVIRCFSVLASIGTQGRFVILMFGQFVCALAQTFILFIPTKFSFVWFSEKQRSLANAIAIGSNFFGILLGSILSPIIAPDTSKIPLLLYLSVIPALLAGILSLGMRSAEPPTPSCKAVVHIRQPFLLSLKRLCRSKSYVVLFIGCGIAIGCFNALSTLVEQMMCPFGYDNVTLGICLGFFIGAGSLGSLVFGYFADRTGKLEEISKILYTASSVAYILLVLFIINRVPRYFIYFAFTFVGFVSLPLSPISMDLCLECVYPIPEATAIGINVMASQIIGILMVVIFPKFGRPLNEYEMSIETCSKDSTDKIVVLNYSTPLYIMAFIMVLMDRLPYELLFSIATHLDSPNDLCSLSRVSSVFLSVSRDDRIWKRLCYRLYNVNPPLDELKQNFYNLFTKILVPYGRYLGYWKSNEMYYGGLIVVHLKISDGTIIGEKLNVANVSDGIAQMVFADEDDDDDEEANESFLKLIYQKTKLFTIDSTSNQILCHQCDAVHDELPWIKTFDSNQQYFGLSHEALSVNERSLLVSHDHNFMEGPEGRDIYFSRNCIDGSIVYHPLSIPRPSTTNTDHPLSRFNGLWVGSYGGHGLELIHVELCHDFTCPTTVDGRSKDVEIISNALVGRKISGDPNVPHSQISFAATHPIEVVDPNSPTSYEGIGQIAHTGYVDAQFIRSKILPISDDVLKELYVFHVLREDVTCTAEIDILDLLFLRNELLDAHIPVAAAVLVNATDILYQDAFGYQSISPIKMMDVDKSIFVLVSIPKTFIAVPIMQLVESNRLDLDTDINRYLSSSNQHINNPQYHYHHITLRQLLSHSVSIGYNLEMETTFAGFGDNAFSEMSLVDAFFHISESKRVELAI
ncbi:unnamed protein product [Rotaria magnacalcarata]|uniref:F-box domain-containing protein n=4 Tax=Rotaria magnacalcarata TaxID=392030 RepID=A0A819J5E2_9BILA|nr:unnamed protein product [Rotaria magnacalcarata]CAF2137029.1 unnamed protein product [Rotaria magnacalcarata]CAF3924803.1 unnamed protein product [Rotaria magnacalcarata]CAF3987723.1 unnamed protein product [Rotaria magnacalcarata]